ncbi:IpaD/SipD/SspD family type III secretion system needle tip protein [Proteus faecis]|uniref:IpaD/SipD/SspD family type III secretion system needle tip protein n=1 Tax=Proteus faecis TaxID=2050967 RepID=UPI0021BB4B15|nr:IpaD/SipD/SspD family type III secretion system needle tip protein [Proteus faecis]MCT8250279.1 IpaD/SipD/SspD family type III secretion system needle tip protein [Proteus faecis]
MINPTNYDKNYKIKYNNIELDNNNKEKELISNNEKNKLIEGFYIEKEKVKLKLKDHLYDYLFSGPAKAKNYHSLKEAVFINHNKYVKNSHNAKKLEKQISDLQDVELKINTQQSHSLRDFFSEIKSSIICGKSDYLDILKDIFSNYMDYVNSVRVAISSLTEYTKASSKEGYINVNFSSFKQQLTEIKKKYEDIGKNNQFFYSNLFFKHKDNGSYLRKLNDQKISYINKAQVSSTINSIEKLLKDIKGIKTTINDKSLEKNQDIDISFIGSIDFSDMEKFISSIDETVSNVEGILSDDGLRKKADELLRENTSLFGFVRTGFDLDAEMDKVIKENNRKKEEAKGRNILNSEFDLFKRSLDTLEKRINTNLDELSKKYSAANSNYDNFVKIVSSTMNVLLEMAKGFLRF